MKNLSEGRKMFISVMAIFAIYATVFVVFEDFDRHGMPLIDSSDLHLPLCPPHGRAHPPRAGLETD